MESVELKNLRWIVPVVGTLAASAGCGGDPYERYGKAVRADVDASMADASQMTARLQLTVVHNRIPQDSLAVVALTVTRAARDVRKRAAQFAALSPPPDFAEPHAGLSAALSRLADALDAMGAAFQGCAEAPCQGRLDSLSSQYGYVGEDLSMARAQVQRLLLRHGVLLGR
jgi:hypothetical protein